MDDPNTSPRPRTKDVHRRGCTGDSTRNSRVSGYDYCPECGRHVWTGKDDR